MPRPCSEILKAAAARPSQRHAASAITKACNERPPEARTMSRKRIVAIVAVLLLGAAFLAGYVPEHQRRAANDMEIQRLRNSLVAAEDRVRTSELLGRTLMVREVTARQDYGHA